MCGIAGIAYPDQRPPDPVALRAMARARGHRGPDDEGEQLEPGIGLASRRLSIQDLSPAGHMPMASPDGRVVLSWNGEIYNHVELREEMKRRGVRFRSTGDTEVLLQLYLAHGPDFLRRLVGMFAIALGRAAAHAPPGARPAGSEAPGLPPGGGRPALLVRDRRA